MEKINSSPGSGGDSLAVAFCAACRLNRLLSLIRPRPAAVKRFLPVGFGVILAATGAFRKSLADSMSRKSGDFRDIESARDF